MAWSALVVRLAGFAVVLPVALARLSSAEVSVWLLFSAIGSLQLLVDFGFSATFSREIAYGFAGGTTLPADRQRGAAAACATPASDWGAIARAMIAMRWLYARLGLATLLLLAALGSLAVAGPIGRIEDVGAGWIGWTIVVAATSVAIWGNANTTLLVGANRVDLLKRWEAANGLFFISLQLAALLCGAGLLGLVAIAQAGVLVQVVNNRRLARRILADHANIVPTAAETRAVLRGLWPAAWRTAIGTISAFGTTQGMAIAMANVLAASDAASVQLGLRLVQILSQFSQVPFYTKIPVFNRLRAVGSHDELVILATKSIRLSLGVFVACAITIDLAIRPLLAMIGSRTAFPGQVFWALLVLACLFERIGGMHVQLLMTTNRTIAHVANLATSMLWIVCLLAAWRWLGPLALPLGMLVAYALFYAPWASHASRAAMGSDLGFELRTSAVPLAVLLCYFALAVLVR